MNIWEKLRAWLNSLAGFAWDRALPAVIILVVGILAAQLVMKLLKRILKKTELEKTAHSIIKSGVRTVLYLVLGLTVASQLGIDITGIVAMASVLTLAISLSLQTALGNVFGGFTLLSNQPFVAGDYVEIAGQSGTVKEVGLAYTKLQTTDNKVVSIPNSAVVAAEIVNYTVSGSRRLEFRVTASYDSPVETVLESLKDAAAGVPTAFQDPAPVAGITNFGDSAIEYVMYVWCKTGDYRATQFAVNKNIKAVFDARGVEMTYPHLNVHLDKE